MIQFINRGRLNKISKSTLNNAFYKSFVGNTSFSYLFPTFRSATSYRKTMTKHGSLFSKSAQTLPPIKQVQTTLMQHWCWQSRYLWRQRFGAKMPLTFALKYKQPLFSNTASSTTILSFIIRYLTIFSRLNHHKKEFVRHLFATTTFKTMEQFITKSARNEDSSNNKKIDDGKIRIFDRPMLIVNNKPDHKVLKIIVEGNIGSGKTTFLSIFSKSCSKLIDNPLIIPEPVDLWRNVGGVNIFQYLADDPKRWSFTFQSYVQLTMLKIHELMPEKGNVKVMERSLYSARYCFVENLYRKGLISNCEYHILDQWFNNCSDSAKIDLIIYLRTDPVVVFERIHRRGRPEESKITLDYLCSLHELHEDWLIRKKFPLPAPVLTIDGNIPLEKIITIYEEKTGGILRQHRILA